MSSISIPTIREAQDDTISQTAAETDIPVDGFLETRLNSILDAKGKLEKLGLFNGGGVLLVDIDGTMIPTTSMVVKNPMSILRGVDLPESVNKILEEFHDNGWSIFAVTDRHKDGDWASSVINTIPSDHDTKGFGYVEDTKNIFDLVQYWGRKVTRQWYKNTDWSVMQVGAAIKNILAQDSQATLVMIGNSKADSDFVKRLHDWVRQSLPRDRDLETVSFRVTHPPKN